MSWQRQSNSSALCAVRSSCTAVFAVVATSHVPRDGRCHDRDSGLFQHHVQAESKAPSAQSISQCPAWSSSTLAAAHLKPHTCSPALVSPCLRPHNDSPTLDASHLQPRTCSPHTGDPALKAPNLRPCPVGLKSQPPDHPTCRAWSYKACLPQAAWWVRVGENHQAASAHNHLGHWKVPGPQRVLCAAQRVSWPHLPPSQQHR